tara:strand:+ start:872 stop:1111 length:240 start_codon:yes stop_codon:yes gene_type:complete
MQTLYEKLKPEFRKVLEKNKEKYKFSCTEVITILKSKNLYSELTIREVRDLLTWSDGRFNREDIEWKFGEDLFGELETQ